MAMAAAARPELAWEDRASLAPAKNAHFTNTPNQLAYALQNEFNSLEGDIRMVGGIPRMAHDKGKTNGLSFADWAAIGARSGKMLRIDIKESSALGPVEQIVRSLNIPPHRITWNISVAMPKSDGNIPMSTALAIRNSYPESWISINVPSYDEKGYSTIVKAGAEIGGKIAIALRADKATQPLIARMKQAMTVNIWNDATQWWPRDIAALTAQLRSMGVDGMIDLRRPDGPYGRP
jgi:hypothetical protein